MFYRDSLLVSLINSIFTRDITMFYRDSLLVSLINCATSVLAGFAVFSLLGFMATTLNKEVGEVVESGRSYFLGAKGGEG
jgi:SNF family Na+-dependent transporter